MKAYWMENKGGNLENSIPSSNLQLTTSACFHQCKIKGY